MVSQRRLSERAKGQANRFTTILTKQGSLLLQRRNSNLDTAVLLAAKFGAVVGDRAGLAKADNQQAARVNTTLIEILANRNCPLFGQLLVILGTARAVRVSVDIKQRLLVFLQDNRDRIQDAGEVGIERCAVRCEGDVARHIQA